MRAKIIAQTITGQNRKELIESSQLFTDLKEHLRTNYRSGKYTITSAKIYVKGDYDPRTSFDAYFRLDEHQKVYLSFNKEKFYSFDDSLENLILIETSWMD